MDKLVSVIIPVYKVEEYLDRCVESVVNQTYENLEIILVDDGSPDECPKKCDEWSQRDKRIKVIHKPNGGLSDARNSGIGISKGSYLMFVDSDDWMPLDSIEILFFNLINTDSDISCGIIKNVFNKRNINVKSTNDVYKYNRVDALEKLMYLHVFSNSASGKIYKASLFKNIKYPFGKHYEDLATTYKLFSKAKRIVSTTKVVYYYFQNNQGIMHKKYSTKRLEGLNFALEELDYVNKYYNSINKAAIYRLFFECLSILNDMPYSNQDKKNVNKYIKQYRKIVLNDPNLSKKQKLLCYSTFFGQFGIKLSFLLKNILQRL